MKDSIYTIPISEVFEPKCGCPICRMRDMLEQRCIEYIMGAAMMEPDVRIETNRYGFCTTHFKMMTLCKNRLSLALMLETHLDELSKKHVSAKARGKKSETPANTCYVCRSIDAAIEKLIDTTLRLYGSDSSFKQMFLSQEFFCFPHYELLCDMARNLLGKKLAPTFYDDITAITSRYLQTITSDVHEFSLMFDYRNANKEKTENVINSIDKAVEFLTTRPINPK